MNKRIPQTFIDEVLTRTDIVSVIEQYLPLKKAGSNYQALCPFHNEKSPSFSVSSVKQFYYCFGCGVSGNSISFLMEYERMPFIEALEQLAGSAGLTLPETQSGQQDSQNAKLYDLMYEVAKDYSKQLKNHQQGKQAKTYLHNRGLTNGIIEHFQLGFAPPGWDHVSKKFGKTGEKTTQLLSAGMLIDNEKGRIYDRFRERIMFPIRDRRGRVIAFGGRVMNDDTPKYLNSPETPIFHKSYELFGLYEARLPKRPLNRLLVVEGYMDVIALAQNGIDFAVATLGTAVTEHHLQRLFRSVKEVVFCFDADSAGARAAWKAAELSFGQLSDQIDVRFLFLPEGEDPDSLVQKEGQKAFLERLNHATSLSQFFLEHLSEEANLETIEGRAKLVSLAIPYLEKIAAPIIQELIIASLAKITSTHEAKIHQWLENKQEPTAAPLAHKQTTAQPSQSSPVRSSITLLLQQPALAKPLKISLPDANIPGLEILKQMINLLQNNPKLSTGVLLEHWRDQPEHKYLCKLATTALMIPENTFAEELKESIKNMHLQALDQEIEVLMAKASAQTLNNDEKNHLNSLLKRKKTGFNDSIPL